MRKARRKKMIAVYVRVSSKQQSIKSQIPDLKRDIEAQGYDDSLVQTYEDRATGKNMDRPGWNMRDQSNIPVHIWCSTKKLFNVDAYKRGDFKQFYLDPRTRVDYLKWAPFLLAAEDFKRKKR